MEEEKNNNNKYSAEYIRKYLDGQLSDQEMQALEKAALEDPFLADAMEGLEESSKHAVSFESGIADLRTKLKERISQSKRKTGILFQLSKWQVAATLFILLGSAVFTVTYINKKARKADIAVSPVKAAADSSAPSIVRSEPENIGSDKHIPDDQIALSPDKPIARRKQATIIKEKNSIRGALDSPVFDQRSALLKRKSDNEVEGNASVLSGKASGVEISESKRDNGSYIQGIVTDNLGKPIPFASVSAKGSKAPVSTDTSGYFKLYLKSDSSGKITVQSAGFSETSARVSANSSHLNRIQMQPTGTSLNEVVVTGYAATDEGGDHKEKKSDAKNTTINKNVQPVTGWNSFYEYLNTNKKIVTTDSLLKGEETVSFDVDAKGGLSDFKIIKSISSAHDDEIIRLVKAGPAWKIKKGKKQICVVSLFFP